MNNYLFALGTLAAVFSVGCQQGSVHPNQEGAGSDVQNNTIPESMFTVKVAGREMSSNAPAGFSVRFPEGEDPEGDLNWQVAEGTSLVVIAPYEVFRAKEVTMDLSDRRVDLFVDGEKMHEGQVQFTLGKGKLTGQAGDVSFEGLLSVDCAATPIGPGTLEDDEDFSTPECAKVRADGF